MFLRWIASSRAAGWAATGTRRFLSQNQISLFFFISLGVSAYRRLSLICPAGQAANPLRHTPCPSHTPASGRRPPSRLARAPLLGLGTCMPCPCRLAVAVPDQPKRPSTSKSSSPTNATSALRTRPVSSTNPIGKSCVIAHFLPLF